MQPRKRTVKSQRAAKSSPKRTAKTPSRRASQTPAKAQRTAKSSSKRTAKIRSKSPAKASPKRTAKTPLHERPAGRDQSLPTANELQDWRFMAVPTGTTPKTLTSRAIANVIDELVAAGVDGHELLAWHASDDDTLLDDSDDAGFTMRTTSSVARTVRFSGRAAVRAGFGALAIAGLLSSLPADVVAAWPGVRAKQRGTAEVMFRVCELLVLGDRPDLDRAWATGKVAAWRYALALAQNRPLMARHWQSQLAKPST